MSNKWKITYLDSTEEIIEYGDLRLSPDGAFLIHEHRGSYYTDRKGTYVIANIKNGSL